MKRKRDHSVTDKDDRALKKLCIDVSVTSNKDSESPSDSQDNICQTKQDVPRRLLGFMYRLDLAVLCSLRKSVYKHKYPSLTLAFNDSEIDKFNNLVLLYKKKSIHVQIEYVDKYFTDDSISYAKLFSKEKRSSFFINDYLDSFAKHVMSKSDSSSNNIENLIIYTNSCLNLTEEFKLKRGRFKNFYPFQFDSIDMEEYNILKDFLFTSNMQGCDFYRFLQDKITRKELLMRLEFSPVTQKVIKEKKLSQKLENEIKEEFLDKLIFAVNQPSREKLNSIIKDEVKKNGKVHSNYIALQEGVLSDLLAIEKLKDNISGNIYKINLIIFFLHRVFLHKNTFSISLGGKSCDTSDITINYKSRNAYVKAHITDSNISYSQLFPSKKQERNNTFSINKHFSLFVEEFNNNVTYFVIYTNADLDVTEEKRLKKVQSKDFYPLKFNSVDKEIGAILKELLFKDNNTKYHGFYQFLQDETTKNELLKRLEFASALQRVVEEKKLSQEEMKEAFLDKLVFVVNQPSREELNDIIKTDIEKMNESNNIPYNYEELHEVALRWLESREFSLTKIIIKKLLDDIKNNRSSYQEIPNENIDEEIKFARSVVGREGTFAFNQFLNFVIKEEGSKHLEVLKRNGISLANVSSILHGAGDKAVRAFKDLYDVWFDEEGNKKPCLKALEKEGINLIHMSSILHGARADAAETFKDLYNLWFDQNGKKTHYLTKLEENQVNLVRVSSILSGAGTNAFRAFKLLYELWFDQNGEETQYLTKLKENGIDLIRMSSILSGAGANASVAFKNLYNLWFDGGNKKQCLKALENEGINLANMSSVLHRAGNKAAEAFKNLYDLWFDQKGKKTEYLTKLEENEVDLVHTSSILSGAGANASLAFKDLYNLWFDKNGEKTQYLTKLEENGVDLTHMSSILSGAGANASRAFKDLYNFWFDEKGNKKQCLKALEKEGINLANASSVLHRAGKDAAQAFKDLYSLWFDKRAGNKTQYLKILKKERINLPSVSSILHGAGNSAAKAFKDLYDLWFDEKGNEKPCLKLLEENGIDLANIASMLGGAGANAAKGLKDLYDVWFDEQGNKTLHLKHFTEQEGRKKSFTMYNLSSILGGTGTSAAKAFEGLHGVCFNDEGKRTELLDDFYNEKFKPSNLSCILCKAGIRASFILKDLHSVCFDEKREKTTILGDFYEAGFKLKYLCSILSGSADHLKEFHDFCFVKKTKKYLEHFLKEGFTPKNLANVLHGARANICSAFKEFHDFCFNDKGERAEPLDDFYKAGFTLNYLSAILCMVGNNATSILRNFHKSCFSKKNYLSHFLIEEEIFTPENLSKILNGAGTKTYSTFEKLHGVCFDKAGKKTDYLENLIENNPPNEIINILYEKVRKPPSTFLDDDIYNFNNIIE